MILPRQIPYLRLLVLLWGAYAAVWLSLEGAPGRDLLLATWGVTLLALAGGARVVGGRRLSAGQVVALAGAVGLAAGAAVVPATLAAMALKTGLHAHGPEYSAAQIAAVWAQWPLWLVAGGVAGVGLGLVALGWGARWQDGSKS